MTRFELRPSARLAAAIFLAHLAAAWSAWISVGGASGLLLGAALAGFGAVVAWNRALQRSPEAVRAIEISAAEVTLELASGVRLAARMDERRYVSRWLVTLPVLAPARRTLLVTRDMLGAEAFRRLRVWALWGKLPVAQPQPVPAGTALH